MISYLITDPKYYGQNPCEFTKKFTLHVNNKKPTFALLRHNDKQNYEEIANVFVPLAKNFKINSFIHTDVNLALKLNAYGVHLPFCHIDKLQKAKQNNLFTIISTHSLNEAIIAQENGANAITFSPIFFTPNKAKPVGLEKLKEIIDKIQINCFSLGGIITPLHVKQCLEVNPYGFASIRYFIN